MVNSLLTFTILIDRLLNLFSLNFLGRINAMRHVEWANESVLKFMDLATNLVIYPNFYFFELTVE